MMRGVDVADTIHYKYNDGQSEALKSSVLSEEVWQKLGDKNYKVRVEGITEELEDLKRAENLDSEVVIRLLSQRPGWKESNFLVNGQSLLIINHLVTSTEFGPAPSAIVVAFLLEKLGDYKNKQLASANLDALAEKLGLGLVLSLCLKHMAGTKAVKTMQEQMQWMQSAIATFGTAGVNVRELVEQLKKTHLSHSNGGVRSASAAAVAQLVRSAGPDVKLLLKDQSASMQNLVQAELENADGATNLTKPASQTSIAQQKIAMKAPSPKPLKRVSAVAQPEPVYQDEAEELVPRVDLSTMVSPPMLEQLESSNWKLRKEALDSLAQILTKVNNRIKPHIGDLQRPLGERLADSNKKLVIQALDIIGNMAKGMGKGFEKHCHAFLPNTLSCLSDKNAMVRSAALDTTNVVQETVGLRAVLPFAIQAISSNSNPLLRTELYQWLARKLGDSSELTPLGSSPKQELQPLVKPSLLCLQNRDPELRKAVQAFVPFLIGVVGFSVVEQSCSSLGNNAATQAALSAIEQYRNMSISAIETGHSSLSLMSSSSTGADASKRATALSSASTIRNATGLKKKASTSLTSLGTSKLSSKSSQLLKATSGLSQSSLAEEKDPALLKLFLVFDSRYKDRRADQKGQLRWHIETAKEDLFRVLYEQTQHCLSEELRGLMFSTDHYKEKDHMQALSILDTQITTPPSPDFGKGLLANLDLVLKYITIRLLDTNTIMTLRSFECLEHVLLYLENVDYRLTEYEGSCLLSFVMFRLGDSKEAIRLRSAGVVKQVCRLYPASKLVHHLLDALANKNARVRSEVFEQLATLIKRNGVAVIAPAKVLPIVAQHIGDRDANVRNAALNVMVQVYLQIGDQIHAYISISDKEGTMLEERLKRLPSKTVASTALLDLKRPQTAKPSAYVETRPPSAVATKSQEPGSGKQSSVREFHLNLEKLGLGSSLSLPGNFPTSGGAPASSTTASSDDRVVELIIEQINSGDLVHCVDGLKQIDRLLEKSTERLPKFANALIDALSLLLSGEQLFKADWTVAQLQRLSKHVVNVLLGSVSRPLIVQAVSRESLRGLLFELLTKMLDQSVAPPAGDSGSPSHHQSMTRAYSLIMIRILDNCDRNLTFGLLLDLLYSSHMSMKQLMVDCRANGLTVPEQINRDPAVLRQANFTELTMKCLWKLTKLLQSMLAQNTVKPEVLFLDIHSFLSKAPPQEWKDMLRQQAPNQDMPYRTVKTILHELVTHLGSPFAQSARSILPPNTQSTALAYIMHALGKKEPLS